MAYFWEHDADRLAVLIGDAPRIASLPRHRARRLVRLPRERDTCRCAQRDQWREDASP